MLVALLLTWGLCACTHYQLMFGSGAQGAVKDMPNISSAKMKALMKALLLGSAASWYAYHIGYLAIMGLIKLSILTFYLSFATHRTFRILVRISIGIVAAMSIVMIFILAFQCPKDPSYALSPAILRDRGAGRCLDLRIVFYSQAGFNIGSDLVILVLPMPLLFSLRMHAIKRFSLIAVFAVGLLVPIASGVRVWGLYLWANSGDLARYYGGYLIFWSQVEINTAIICASAPSFQPLLKRIFGELSWFQRSRGALYHYGGGHQSVAGPPVAEMTRHMSHGSSILQSPNRVYYSPKTSVQGECQTQVVIMNTSPEEGRIRDRIRELSRISSVYSQPLSARSACSTPTLPTHPSNLHTNGWV
ncbi:hypothetical protein BKA66DRAFT_88283 [Pyrenochaeta sp. MPI-SDFR-AT-0127]|nr:hypothetical protein BKA66DRAFT_88283 [Pyrenochaeta sp. MPI-SDFR-AT-0127]